MKHRTVRALVYWALLAFLGILALIVLSLLPVARWIGWLTASVLWAAVMVWGVLHFLTGAQRRPKKPAAFSGNGAVFERISRECTEAVGRYLESVRRKGILKARSLYERPWFLMCGPAGSGKTTLLRGCGVDFPLTYPSEKDGLVLETEARLRWFFGNNAVWVDVPGAFLSSSGTDEWRASVSALARVRSSNPVDGVAVAVGGSEILSAEPAEVKRRATELRKRIDELIASWGIEFPVFIVFTRMDEVPGFSEFFHALPGKSNDQILGATLSEEQHRVLPRRAFEQEFQLLCASLAERRLDVLGSEKDGARKRMICRFAIHFEGMQEKLADFITELFKPSSYEGKPIFYGFYFTSCTEVAGEETVSAMLDINLSATIASHPFNPRHMKIAAGAAQPKKDRPRFVSYFAAPLISEIITRERTLVKRTQKRSRKETARHYAVAAVLLLAVLAAILLMVSSWRANRRFLDGIQSRLQSPPPIQSYNDAYRRFGDIGTAVRELQRHDNEGVPWGMKGGFYRGSKVLEKLKPEFIALSAKLIVHPSVRYLEYRINDYCDDGGELSGDAHLGLYRSLKAYLSLSEALSRQKEHIDTTFLRKELVGAITQTVLRAERQARLPEEVETILQDNVGLFLLYLKSGEIPLIQENQRLVSTARRYLQRLPDARALYETVANRLVQEVGKFSLADILDRREEGIIRSDVSVSVIYTQEGWERYVQDAIAEASKDPFKVDWVIGASKGDMSAAMPDPKQLRDAMTEAYFTDYTEKWLEFLSSMSMEPFGDLSRSARILQKLTGEQSELAVVLETVSARTLINEEAGMSAGGEKALAAASKLKATAKVAKRAQQAKAAAGDIKFTRKSGPQYLSRTFDPLRSFARSTGGALGGYEGYRDRILTLVEKLADIEERGDDHAVAVFNGSDSDPLLGAWKYTQSVIASMPDDLGAACSTFLLLPISYTGAAASRVLTERLNARWQEEVVQPFTGRLAGNYPFNSGSVESSSFSDVMDFFRPATGTLWGFHQRVLAPFVIKSSSGWSIISVGSLDIAFNPSIAATLKAAGRISEIFFKPDGTLRSLNITVSPLARNKHQGTLDVCGQVLALKPGGQSAQLRWPIESSAQGASLKVAVSDDFTQDISFTGRWGLMQLFQKARVNVLSKSSFDATWEMNVQNMYMAYFTCRVQVAGDEHPFGEPVFTTFDCPTNLTVAAAKPAQSPQEDQ